MRRPTVHTGYTLVTEHLACVKATLHRPGDNPFLPVAASDARGTLHALDFDGARPGLVELIRSEPHVVRGNHVHLGCTELFTVITGEIRMYLLCECPERHVLEVPMTAGATVTIPPGTAHALYTDTPNESLAAFPDGDPRDDRDRVLLLEYNPT